MKGVEIRGQYTHSPHLPNQTGDNASISQMSVMGILSPNLRVAFASGGSGGHLYPGLAVAQELLNMRPGAQALFFTSEKAVEADIVLRNGFNACAIPSCPPCIARLPEFFGKLRAGYGIALRRLKEFRPQAMIALGGFSSFAPALAARRLGIPVFVQEQNSVAGRANVALSLLSKAVFTPYPGMKRQFPLSRVSVTGNPMRVAARAQDRQRALGALGLEPGKFTVLVLGGSQGARFLNQLVHWSLDKMIGKETQWQWIHLTGKEDADAVRQYYADKGWKASVHGYYEAMGDCYGACDLVVSRAGASTLSEITGNALPSVLIPYPSAIRDHQRKNAQMLSAGGAALVLDEELLTPGAFSSVLLSLHRDHAKLERMRQAAQRLHPGNAAARIAEAILESTARGA